MPALTLTEINDQNPEKVYDMPLTLNIENWKKINLPISMPSPEKIEFNEDIRNNLPTNIKYKKGIYMFFVEPEFPFSPRLDYLLYIGRVIKGNTFFKRFYDYVNSIGSTKPRRNIQFLTNLWEGKTFVYFFDIQTNDDDIIEIEKQLIKYIAPSLNSELILKGAHNPHGILN